MQIIGYQMSNKDIKYCRMLKRAEYINIGGFLGDLD